MKNSIHRCAFSTTNDTIKTRGGVLSINFSLGDGATFVIHLKP